MAKQARDRPSHRVNIVTQGTVLEGTLHTEGDVHVSGRVVGNVTAGARVVVAATGVIDGAVGAAHAEVTGAVEGDLEVARGLVLRTGARVGGSVKAGMLIVEDGAVFNGVCRMVLGETPPAPMRKRPKGFSRQAAPGPLRLPGSKTAFKASASRGKKLRRTGLAALGILLVMILASGVYYGFEAMSGAAQDAATPSAGLPTASAESPAEAETASLDPPGEAPLYSVSETPADDPADFAAPIDEARQAAGLDRITMAQARRTILSRRDEPEVAVLYQQAETTRQAGLRHFDAGAFEQAVDSFRLARDLFTQIQQRLSDKDRAGVPENLPDTVSEDRAEDTEDAPSDLLEDAPPEATQGVDTEETLQEVRPVVSRLARQLKLSIEREDITGMQALFYRGWTPFFDEAEAISAAVRYENLQRSGTEVTADIYLDLAFQDEENQPRQRAHAYLWTLMRLEDEWVLRQVVAR